jgi:diguanylate cyclase (GGDEF)-like protein
MPFLPASPPLSAACLRVLLLALACLLGLGGSGGLARAQAPGAGSASEWVLGADDRSHGLWSQWRWLPPGLSPEGWGQAEATHERLQPLPGAHATLGLQPGPVWLALDLRVPSTAAGPWVLDINYPPLQDVRAYVVSAGVLLQEAHMGSLLPPAARPLHARSLAAVLELPPGSHRLWLRVQTQGAMVLPITLSRPSVFHGRSLDEQMLQGVLVGLALCLLVYSLWQWASLRDTLFLKYAVMTLGSLVFSLQLFGIGGLYLWPGSAWMEHHAAGFSALMAAVGSFLFIEHALRGPQVSRAWRRCMGVGALLAATVALCYALDLVSTRAVTALMSVLGAGPALMGLPGAFRRMRAGDEVGRTFLLAWAVYAVATLLVIGVIRGALPVNFWTQHAFQFGATVDMLLFMRVLSLRTRAIERVAREATIERDHMVSLAHTDPLTGLPNRRGLNEVLQSALQQCSPQRLLAIYVLDLDGFKPVNDQHGHDVGDELLVAVAQRLRGHIRATDLVARVGGDEFVLVAGGLPDDPAAQDLGLKLRDAFQAPFVVRGLMLRVGLTLGYALAPLDGRQAVDLLRRADAAMYAGKQAGKLRLVRAQAAL